MLKLLKLLFALAIALLGAAIASLNPEMVRVSYYFGAFQLPLGILLFLLLGTGVILGALASLLMFVRIKRENADLRRQARLASTEVRNLRSMPLRDH